MGAFVVHHDKSLPSDVLFAAWCPTMDLLLAAAADGSLAAYRAAPEHWAKLWALTPERRPTAVAWAPDGRSAAVGFDDGAVGVIDAETGAERARLLEGGAPHAAAVIALHWGEQPDGAAGGAHEPADSSDDDCEGRGGGSGWNYEDRAPRFFPPLLAPPPPPGSAEAAAAFDAAAGGAGGGGSQPQPLLGTRLEAPARLSMLVSGDASGRVVLSAAGALVIGVLELGGNACVGAGARAVAATLGPQLDWLLLAARHGERERQLSAVVVRAPLLFVRRNELRALAHQAAAMRSLLKAAREGTAAARRAWDEARAPFAGALAALAKLCRDYGEPPRSSAEVLVPLLTSGTAGSALQQWLANTATEAGARRMGRDAVTAGDSSQSLLADHVVPAAEELVFRLGELLGLARCTAQLGPLGIEAPAVERALGAAKALLLRAERVRSQAASDGAGYQNLLAGIGRAARALDADGGGDGRGARAGAGGGGGAPPVRYDAVAATDFLRQRVGTDRVAAALGCDSGGEAAAAAAADEDHTFDFLGDASPAGSPATTSTAPVGGAAQAQTLSAAIEEALDAVSATFAGAQRAVSPTLQVEAVVRLVGEGASARAVGSDDTVELRPVVSCERAPSAGAPVHCAFAGASGAQIGVLRATPPDIADAPSGLDVAIVTAPGSEPRVAALAMAAEGEVVALAQCAPTGGAGTVGEATTTEFAAARGVELLDFSPVSAADDDPVIDMWTTLAPQDAEEAGMLVRRRVCGSGFASCGPLAVGARGMALATMDQQRVLVLDLEEDEDEDDENEEGDVEDMAQ